jgi:purine-binding chemotaxis protein CheW
MADNVDKYLVFSIADEKYGVPITKVREVIRHELISPVHNATSYLKGVINLRGRIVPIIDMRLKFGMEGRPYNDRTVFIIVDVNGEKEVYNFGIAVDSVHDVATIADDQVEKLPDVGFKTKSAYLQGIAKVGTLMVMVLNIDRILNSTEVLDLTGLDAVGKA